MRPSLRLRTERKILRDWDPVTSVQTRVASSAPLIAFDTPELGVPDGYLIQIVELQPDSQSPSRPQRPSRTVLVVLASSNAFRIPAGVLASGRRYHVRVRAFTGTVEAPTARWTTPLDTWAHADAITAPFTVA